MKSKESLIKTATSIAFATLMAVSAIILIYGWLGGHFNSIDKLRDYVDSFRIWGAADPCTDSNAAGNSSCITGIYGLYCWYCAVRRCRRLLGQLYRN